MTALDVARKDLEDAIRSRALWFVSAIFVAVMSISAALPTIFFDDPGAEVAVAYIQGPATHLLLPMIALMLGYRAIVGERERGSVKFLLSLPHSRLDVLVGKLVGRSAVLAIAIVIAVLVTGVVITLLYGVPPLDSLLYFLLLTILAGATFTAIAVSVSAMVSTRVQALSILVGGFLLSTMLWDRILSGVHYLVAGEFPGEESLWWVQLLTQLNPVEAYSTAGILLLPDIPYVHFDVDGAGIDAETVGTVAVPESAYVFYDAWFVLGVLFVWIVVPAAIGYVRFRSADLT